MGFSSVLFLSACIAFIDVGWTDFAFRDNLTQIVAIQRNYSSSISGSVDVNFIGASPPFEFNPFQFDMGGQVLTLKQSSMSNSNYIVFKADEQLHPLNSSLASSLAGGLQYPYFKASYVHYTFQFCNSISDCTEPLYQWNHNFYLLPKTYRGTPNDCSSLTMVRLQPINLIMDDNVTRSCLPTIPVADHKFGIFRDNGESKFAKFTSGSLNDGNYSEIYIKEDSMINNTDASYPNGVIANNVTFGSDMKFKVSCVDSQIHVQFCRGSYCYTATNLIAITFEQCINKSYKLKYIYDQNNILRMYELPAFTDPCNPGFITANDTITSRCVFSLDGVVNFMQNGEIQMMHTFVNSTLNTTFFAVAPVAPCTTLYSPSLRSSVSLVNANDEVGLNLNDCSSVDPDLKFRFKSLIKTPKYATNYSVDTYYYNDDKCSDLHYIKRKIVNLCPTNITFNACHLKSLVYCQLTLPNSNNGHNAEEFHKLPVNIVAFKISKSADLLEYLYYDAMRYQPVIDGIPYNSCFTDATDRFSNGKCVEIGASDYSDFTTPNAPYFSIIRPNIYPSLASKTEFMTASGHMYFWGISNTASETTFLKVCSSEIPSLENDRCKDSQCSYNYDGQCSGSIEIDTEVYSKMQSKVVNNNLYVQFFNNSGYTSSQLLQYNVNSSSPPTLNSSYEFDSLVSPSSAQLGVVNQTLFIIIKDSTNFYLITSDNFNQAISTYPADSFSLFLVQNDIASFWFLNNTATPRELGRMTIRYSDTSVILDYQFVATRQGTGPDHEYIIENVLPEYGGVYFNNSIAISGYDSQTVNRQIVLQNPLSYGSLQMIPTLVHDNNIYYPISNFVVYQSKLYYSGIYQNGDLYLTEITALSDHVNTFVQKTSYRNIESANIKMKLFVTQGILF